MAMLTIDPRSGRTDEQKRVFAAAVLQVVSAATRELRENDLLTLGENPGIVCELGFTPTEQREAAG